MTREQIDVLRRGEECGWPHVLYGGSMHVSGEASWRAAVPDMLPGHVYQVAAQLAAIEPGHRRRVEADKREEERLAARDAPFTDEERARIDEDLAEANARAARADSTEGRLGRIEEVLGEIRDSLRKRA